MGDEEKERAEFEAWSDTVFVGKASEHRIGRNGYSIETIGAAWLGWRAARRTDDALICANGRTFLAELAVTMGVIDMDADTAKIRDVMPKMLERAREDRERWHATPSSVKVTGQR